MEVVCKIAALCIVSSLFAALLRQNESGLALVVTLASVLCALALLVSAGNELYRLVEEVRELTGLAPTVLIPLVKVVLIALVVRLGGALCRDAGQSALSAVLETAGTVCALLAAAPLLRAVLELANDWL